MNEWISSNNEKVMAVPLGAIEVITGRAVRWLAGDVTIVVYWTAADVRKPGPLVGRLGGRVGYWMAGGVRVWLDSSLQAMDTSSWWTQSWRPQPLWGQLPSCVSAPVHSKSSSQICPWPPLYLLSSERPLRLQQVHSYCVIWVCNPFSSDRQHLSNDGMGDYQNCSVLHCILKLCTVISTLRWAVLTVPCIGFCFTGPIHCA